MSVILAISRRPEPRTLPLPTPDNSLAAIAHRVRVVVERTPGYTLDEVSESLLLEPIAFRRLVEDEENPLDHTSRSVKDAAPTRCAKSGNSCRSSSSANAATHRPSCHFPLLTLNSMPANFTAN